MDKDFELHCNVFHSLKVFKVFAKANRVIPREGQNNILKEYSAVHLPMFENFLEFSLTKLLVIYEAYVHVNLVDMTMYICSKLRTISSWIYKV